MRQGAGLALNLHHVSFSPFHGVLSCCSGAPEVEVGRSNEIHCSSVSELNGKGLVSKVNCVELIRWNIISGKVTKVSSSRSKRTGTWLCPYFAFEENILLKGYSICRCGSKTRDF